MRAEEISNLLANDALSICKMLLPNGTENNNFWEVGDISGREGKSLRVNHSGRLVGRWKDFATGEGGDLIDLWGAVKGLSFIETFIEAKQHLGIEDNVLKQKNKPKLKPITMDANEVKEDNNILKFFEDRGLSEATVQAYKVKQKDRAIIFPCYKGDKLFMTKSRNGEKRFWANKDAQHILFGWQVIPANSRVLVITEGELDCMSYYEQGIPAVSVPFGAGQGGKHKWVENEFDYLEAFDKIYISMDMDNEGEIAKKDLIERLGRHRCFPVELPFKDANECIMNDINLQEFLDKAQTEDPIELRNTGDFEEDIVNSMFSPLARDRDMMSPWAKMHENLQFRPQETSLWTGFNGSGKSQVLGHIGVDGMSQGYKFCIASLELTPVQLIKRMVMQMSGMSDPSEPYVRACMQWISKSCWIFRASGKAKSQQILDVFRYARSRYGVDHFILDSLMKTGVPNDDYQGQQLYVDDLVTFAQDHNCHLHLVAHSRKKENEQSAPTKMDVKGTSALTDLVDNVFSVWRDKTKETAISNSEFTGEPVPEKIMNKADVKINCDKNRHGGWEGVINLWFDKDSLQYLEHSGARPKSYVEWTSDTDNSGYYH